MIRRSVLVKANDQSLKLIMDLLMELELEAGQGGIFIDYIMIKK
jgi:hypothetical protein